MSEHLTEKEDWEAYWKKYGKEVQEIKRSSRDSSHNLILDAMHRYLPKKDGLTVLEIGGAPGQYLLYMVKNFGYKASSLDYSSEGNEQTRRNFAAAGLPITVYEKDLFSGDLDDLPKFDVVYSLGFIEHFTDRDEVIRKHTALLKPGGTLMVGVPNFTGIYKVFLARLNPALLAQHNLATMNIRNWASFEKLGLAPVFKGYIGGFEPSTMNQPASDRASSRSLLRIVNFLIRVFSFRFHFLRKFNSRLWSGYLLGIYTKQ